VIIQDCIRDLHSNYNIQELLLVDQTISIDRYVQFNTLYFLKHVLYKLESRHLRVVLLSRIFIETITLSGIYKCATFFFVNNALSSVDLPLQ